jgi:hypothetical protein
MTYTFLSASFANAEKTAVVAMTAESGAVALSRCDTPADWRDLKASGVKIAPYVEQSEPPQPSPTEKLALFLSANPDVMDLISGP